jgi:hypothetical protein
MFRFTIRELLILTMTAGLAVGWWLEHRAHVEVATDASRLASFSAHGVDCSIGHQVLVDLEEKYGAHRGIKILDEDEAKLGIEIEQ